MPLCDLESGRIFEANTTTIVNPVLFQRPHFAAHLATDLILSENSRTFGK